MLSDNSVLQQVHSFRSDYYYIVFQEHRITRAHSFKHIFMQLGYWQVFLSQSQHTYKYDTEAQSSFLQTDLPLILSR